MASAALFAGFDRAPITEGPLERHLFDEVINVCLVSLNGPVMANGLDISILPTASQRTVVGCPAYTIVRVNFLSINSVS